MEQYVATQKKNYQPKNFNQTNCFSVWKFFFFFFLGTAWRLSCNHLDWEWERENLMRIISISTGIRIQKYKLRITTVKFSSPRHTAVCWAFQTTFLRKWKKVKEDLFKIIKSIRLMLGYIVLISIFNYFVLPTRIHSISLNFIALSFSLIDHLTPILLLCLLLLFSEIRFVEDSKVWAFILKDFFFRWIV